MNTFKFSSQIALYVCVLGVKCLLKRLFGLSQGLDLNLVGFYACVEVVEFFLKDKHKDTSAAVRRSLNDIFKG